MSIVCRDRRKSKSGIQTSAADCTPYSRQATCLALTSTVMRQEHFELLLFMAALLLQDPMNCSPVAASLRQKLLGSCSGAAESLPISR